MTDLPKIAISVRQPWAWAIFNGKDVENRSRFAIERGGMSALVGKRIAIHASKGMTRDEYFDAFDTIRRIVGRVPDPDKLTRGGIIGSVIVGGIVKNERDALSPWFFGPWALRLVDPIPCEFVGAVGFLGAFEWRPNNAAPDPAKPWMRPKPADKINPQPSLFGKF